MNPYGDEPVLNPYGDAPVVGNPYGDTPLTNPEDTQEMTALGVVGQFAKATNQGVTEFMDFIGPGAVNAIMRLTGNEEYQIPTFTQGLQGAQELTTGDTRENFMPAGTARDVVDAAGTTLSMAPGFVGVERAAHTTGSLVQEFLGLGTTKMDDLYSASTRIAQMGPEELATEDDIYKAAYRSAKKDVIERNRPMMEKYEETMEGIYKKNMKWGPTQQLVIDEDVPEAITKVDLSRVTKELEDIYDISPQETLRVLKEKGALTKKGNMKIKASMDDLIDADKQFVPETGLKGTDVSWWESVVHPMTEVMRNHVGGNVAGAWERAVETATRLGSRVAEEVGVPITKVGKLAETNLTLKRAMMDLHRKPKAKMKEIRSIIKAELGADELASWDRFMGVGGKQAAEGRKHLYKMDSGFDDPFYIHTEVKNKRKGSWLKKAFDSHAIKPSALKDRGRKAAWEMTDEELAEYANPVLTHLKHLQDEQHLLQIAKKFNLRPSMAKNSSTQHLFEEVERKLIADGMDPKRAEAAKDLMGGAFMGSTKVPPPLVRASMSMGYAGTLAQYKSAMLNLHDIFVSMTNQGVKPTLKALTQSNQSLFGKSMTEMGIGDNQSMGEFVRGFDDYFGENTTTMKIAKGAEKVTENAFKYSGFKLMDQIGKGTVLRAAYNNAVKHAQKGELTKVWGNILSTDELRQVRPWLKKGVDPKEMPAHIARMVEEASFSKLGEQQLISMAGRPLQYAQHVWARPLYAMTGFAIKQRAMLMRNVYEEAKRGNFKEAGTYMAKYATFAGLGYGLIDETRDVLFTGDEFRPEDIMFGAVEQMGAALTLNRVGDMYSVGKIADDPYGYLVESVVPPLGLPQALGKDAANMIMKGEYNGELARKFPVIGDFYNYYWFPRGGKRKERPGKWEQAGEFVGSWGEE